MVRLVAAGGGELVPGGEVARLVGGGGAVGPSEYVALPAGDPCVAPADCAVGAVGHERARFGVVAGEGVGFQGGYIDFRVVVGGAELQAAFVGVAQVEDAVAQLVRRGVVELVAVTLVCAPCSRGR